MWSRIKYCHGLYPAHMCSKIASRVISRTSSKVWCGIIRGQSSLRDDLAVWLSHTSSVLPWSGMPKVRMYDTFVSSLQHAAIGHIIKLNVMDNQASQIIKKISPHSIITIVFMWPGEQSKYLRIILSVNFPQQIANSCYSYRTDLPCRLKIP